MEKYLEEDVYRQIINNFKNLENDSFTDDDKTFKDTVTAEIGERDKQYSELLKHFVYITKVRNIVKEGLKIVFYASILIFIYRLFALVKLLFVQIIEVASPEQLLEAIPLFITAFVGFASVVIAIPMAITKYLFSTKEDKYITGIIMHTQEHDTSGREWILKLKKILENSNIEKIEPENLSNFDTEKMI